MKKTKTGYVPTTLDSFINESQTINLKRGYRGQPGVSVGTNAPARDRILQFVAESKTVSRKQLKGFIAGLNETSKNPIAAANMWMKRNGKFFIAESKNGSEMFKLSTVGKRLVNRLTKNAPVNEKKEHDFVDTKKGYPRPGINDDVNEEEEDLNEFNIGAPENTYGGPGPLGRRNRRDTDGDGIPNHLDSDDDNDGIVDQHDQTPNGGDHWDEVAGDDFQIQESRIERLKRVLNEAEEEEEVDDDDELSFDDLDLGDDEEGEEVEGEAGDELDLGDDEGDTDLEKVEISEFIITVDDANDALAELKALGVDAEVVEDDEGDAGLEGDEYEEELDLGDEGGDELDLGDDELDLGNDELDLGDDMEGDELDLEEGAEIGSSIGEAGEDEDLEARLSSLEVKVEELETEHDDLGGDEDLEFEDDDMGAEDDLGLEDDGLGGDEDLEDGLELGDDGMEGEEIEDVEMGSQEIRVSAEDFPALKGWLEDKGVDVDDVLGGEVEVEGDEDDFEVGDSEEADVESGDLEDAGEESEEEESEEEEDAVE
jgi:hypothetical protein